jgi:hypothetical protein
MKDSKKQTKSTDLNNPCIECLVRACCAHISCPMLRDYLFEVLKLVADDPQHRILKEQFNEEQASTIIYMAKMYRKNED